MTSLPPRDAFVLQRGTLHRLPSPSVLGIPLTWRALAGYDLLSPAARAPARARAARFRARRDRRPTNRSASFFARRFGRATVELDRGAAARRHPRGRHRALSMHSLFPRLRRGRALSAAASCARSGDQRAAGGRRRVPIAASAAWANWWRRSSGACLRALVRLATAAADADPRRARLARRHRSGDVDGRRRDPRAPGVRRGRVCWPASIARPRRICARGAVRLDRERRAGLAERARRASAAGHRLRRRARHRAAAASPRARGSRRSGPARAPTGTVLLRAFIGGAHDPDAVDLSDDELVALAARDLTPSSASPARRSSRASIAGATPARSTRRPPRAAGADRAAAGGAAAGCSSPAAAFASIGIPDCVADGRAAAAAAAADFVQRSVAAG